MRWRDDRHAAKASSRPVRDRFGAAACPSPWPVAPWSIVVRLVIGLVLSLAACHRSEAPPPAPVPIGPLATDVPAPIEPENRVSPATEPASEREALHAETDSARLEFQLGVQAFEDGSYDEALVHFERSYALSGEPALLFNIGVTAERMGRNDEAIHSYEEYLRQAPSSAVRQTVEARLSALRGGTAAPLP